jgi:hypothetical protein
MEDRMLIRQAFQTFLQLQSEAEQRFADAAPPPARVGPAWPMDHQVRSQTDDWVIDWRWFAE